MKDLSKEELEYLKDEEWRIRKLYIWRWLSPIVAPFLWRPRLVGGICCAPMKLLEEEGCWLYDYTFKMPYEEKRQGLIKGLGGLTEKNASCSN